MEQDTTYVGLDVHKETIAVAIAEGRGGAPRSLGTVANEPVAVAKLMRKLGPLDGLVVCYEAGPTGYVLYRQLAGMGIACVVVAPSLVPQKPGDRVKTDRRDALKLVRLLRGGELDPIWVPDPELEALRDLTRARDRARLEVHRARQRVLKLLLRQGVRAAAGVRTWTARYREWVKKVTLPLTTQQVALEEYLSAVEEGVQRVGRLEAAIGKAVQGGPYAGVIAAVQALRGVGLVTAAALVAELGDLRRFRSPRQLMGYVGVVAGEHSSGQRQRRGGITKTGNAYARYVVVEAAWHYRHRPAVGAQLKRRQAGLAAAVTAIAWKAQQRLYRRYWRLLKLGKDKGQVAVAVARELLGFLWAIGQVVPAAVPAAAVA